MYKPVAAVYVNAGNSPSGNPRRGWIIYSRNTDGYVGPTNFVDEGYNGTQALRMAGIDPRIGDGPALPIAPSVYNGYVKTYGKAAA